MIYPQVPELIDPILAWRAWLIVETAHGPRLHSTARACAWQHGIPMNASCHPPTRVLPWPRRARHVPPSESCTCGVYAAADVRGALAALDPYPRLGWKVRHRIIGQVALWGRVVECTDGYRAEYGYPSRLVVPARRLHDEPIPDPGSFLVSLAAYGVPVQIVDAGTRGDLAAALDASMTAP